MVFHEARVVFHEDRMFDSWSEVLGVLTPACLGMEDPRCAFKAFRGILCMESDFS